MKTRPCFIHVLSPLHAGTGQSAELVDLPIARLKGSGIPFLPGSSIMGVLRDAARESVDSGSNALTKEQFLAVFGPDTDDSDDARHAGALICMDARLLCLPVRCFQGTFAYTTSPLLLHLASRDISNAPPIPELNKGTIAITDGSVLHGANHQRIYLEDLDLIIDATHADAANKWAPHVAKAVPGNLFAKRFAIVADDVMTFLWETATQLDTRVRIDSESRTVAERALWTEECLPAETLLVGMLGAERTRRSNVGMAPNDVLDKILQQERVLQFGGKATVGRGRCRLLAA